MNNTLIAAVLVACAGAAAASAQERPPRPPREGPPRGRAGYSIEQAISDRAQLNTIAFDGGTGCLFGDGRGCSILDFKSG